MVCFVYQCDATQVAREKGEAMYAISDNESGPWESDFPTLENAIEIGKCTYEGSFFVGKLREPRQPEMFFNAQEWIDSVAEQDDYHEDENWCDANYLQILELERKVRQVMTEWLDTQDLRPKFTIVDDIEEIVVEEPSQGSEDPTEPITDEEIDALVGFPIKPKNDQATGKHPDIIIIDDPLFDDQATSKGGSSNDKAEEHESK